MRDLARHLVASLAALTAGAAIIGTVLAGQAVAPHADAPPAQVLDTSDRPTEPTGHVLHLNLPVGPLTGTDAGLITTPAP